MMTTTSRFFLLLATAITLASGSAIQAAEVYFDTVSTEKAVRMHGAYFGLFGGGATDFEVEEGKGLEEASQRDENGWFVGAEVGYQFRTPFPLRPAIELELFYLANDYRADVGGGKASADMYHVPLMANAILALDLSDYREDLGFLAAFHPYIGAGVGAAYSNVSNSSLETADGRTLKLADGSKVTFAYQIIAGLEIELSDYFSIYGEYRRLWIDDIAGATFTSGDQNLWGAGFKVQY